MVDDHRNPPGKVHVGDAGPEKCNAHHAHRGPQQEPALFDPTRPGHDHENQQVGQSHAEIPRGPGQQGEHEQGVSGDLHDRPGAADALLLEPGHLPGQQEHKGELDNLAGLEVHRKAGYVYPAIVAGVALHLQRGAHQKVENDIKKEHQLPGPLGKQLDVHRGQEDIDQHPQENGGALYI